MDRLTAGLIIAAFVVLLFAIMWRSWRRRSSRDARHGTCLVPATFSATHDFDVQYVATTQAGEPLERLALPGLGFRGLGRLRVGASGAVIAVTGEVPVFLPASTLRAIDASQVVIDRVVEKDGLIRIAWVLPDGTPCDSYLRLREPADQPPARAALSDLLPPHRAGSAFESESNA